MRATDTPISSSLVRRAYRRQLLIAGLALAMLVFAALVLLMEVRLNEEVEARYQQALSIAQEALSAHRVASEFAREHERPGVDSQAAEPAAQVRERLRNGLAQLSVEIDRLRELPLTEREQSEFRQIQAGLSAIEASTERSGPASALLGQLSHQHRFESIAASLDSLGISVAERAQKATERSRFLNLIARYTLALTGLLAVSFGAVFAVLMWRSQMASREVMAALDRMAREDSLTGITNRRGLDEGLAVELARARRTRTELTAVMLDLDHFKRYNDRRGHGAGDVLLRSAAQAWRRQLRPTDLLARYGGEEFTLVLPACDADAACQLIERLRPLMPEHQTFSAGVATWEHHESPEQLLARADRALLVAKKQGRNRTIVSGREPQMVLPLTA